MGEGIAPSPKKLCYQALQNDAHMARIIRCEGSQAYQRLGLRVFSLDSTRDAITEGQVGPNGDGPVRQDRSDPCRLHPPVIIAVKLMGVTPAMM